MGNCWNISLTIRYIFILFFILFCVGPFFLIRYYGGQPLNWGRYLHVAYVAQVVQSVTRKFFAVLRHFMTRVKVAFILAIKFGFFPLICGCWLEDCTIRMFGKASAQRVAFFLRHPVESSVHHWIVGFLYMLQLSFSMDLLQGV